MIRVAAVGDLHVGTDSDDRLVEAFAGIDEHADVLLLAGDLTKCGTPDEARVVVHELERVTVPMIAVLGNHDHHDGRPEAVADILGNAGDHVLEGHAAVLDLPGGRLGVAGVKGFGGGFAGANASAFGEPEMKAFVQHTHTIANRLGRRAGESRREDCDARVALLHYSPTPDTLVGERLEIYPFLGSGLLGRGDRPGRRRPGAARPRPQGRRRAARRAECPCATWRCR